MTIRLSKTTGIRHTTNSNSRNFNNRRHNRLQNGDKRKVSFDAPRAATGETDEEEMERLEFEGQLRFDEYEYDEQEKGKYDDPNTNAIKLTFQKYTVCEGNHPDCECEHAKPFNVTSQQSWRIEQSRLINKVNIREQHILNKSKTTSTD